MPRNRDRHIALMVFPGAATASPHPTERVLPRFHFGRPTADGSIPVADRIVGIDVLVYLPKTQREFEGGHVRERWYVRQDVDGRGTPAEPALRDLRAGGRRDRRRLVGPDPDARRPAAGPAARGPLRGPDRPDARASPPRPARRNPLYPDQMANAVASGGKMDPRSMPTAARAEAPYDAAEKSVHAHLCGMGERVDRLKARLERFLKPPLPPGPGAPACAQPVSPQSDAVRGLHEIGGRIQMSAWALDDILDRLDV